MYYVMKRYFLPEPTWLRSPHWNPVAYATWEEARDAYIKERLSNVRALGVAGYPAVDIDIRYMPVSTSDHDHDHDEGPIRFKGVRPVPPFDEVNYVWCFRHIKWEEEITS